MNLQFSEEQQFIQDTARRFAQDELLPVAEKLDLGEGRELLLENLNKLAQLGFMGLNISAEYGGTEAASSPLVSPSPSWVAAVPPPPSLSPSPIWWLRLSRPAAPSSKNSTTPPKTLAAGNIPPPVSPYGIHCRLGSPPA